MKCPCHSAKRHAECCQPFHAGAVAPTPELLMRSRYAAFALGLTDYLQLTLAASHEDKGRVIVLSAQKYAGLRIVWAEGNEVLFLATVYHRGRDVSFAELSTFDREGDAWRYASGVLVPKERLPRELTRATFLQSAMRTVSPRP